MRILPVLLLLSSLPSAAEEVQARFTAGTTAFADEGTVAEATVGGSVRLYFSGRWSVEPELLHARKDGDHNTFLWGNVAYDILRRDRKVVPYWYAGPGLVRHSTSFGGFHFTNHEASFGTGAGVRFLIADRVFVAPQFRLGVADGVFAEITGSIGYIWKK